MQALAEATGEPYEKVKRRYINRAPLKRMVTPEEVAECAVFLASEESSGMTGQIIEVSAGG